MNTAIRSIRNVLRNPLRLFLVVLLLGVSLMFVAAMFGLNTSAQEQLANVHKNLGTGITINYATNEAASANSGGGNFGGGGPFGGDNSSQSVVPIPDSTITKVAAVPGIARVQENLQRQDTDGILKGQSLPSGSQFFLRNQGQTSSFPITVSGISNGATDFTLLNGSTPTIVSGRSFENSDASANVAVMGQSLADTNNLKVGSTFTLKGSTFTIIGLFTSSSNNNNRGRGAFGESTIIVPLATMEKIYGVAGVDSITAYATTADQVSTVADQIRTVLGNQYDVVTQQSLIDTIISSINSSQNSIQLALIVSIVAAAVVIIFAVFLLVRERTTEIGTLKAIGASPWQVIRQFWSEVLILSLLSAAAAVVLLVTIGPAVARQFSVATRGGFGGRGGGVFFTGGGGGGGTFFGGGAGRLSAIALTPENVLIIVGLGIALALLASFIPTWYVMRLKPADVLRKGN